MKIKPLAKKILSPAAKAAKDMESEWILRHSRKLLEEKCQNKDIHVGFLVFEPQSWDKLETIYDEMKKNERFHLHIVLIPSFDKGFSLHKDYGDEKEYFSRKYKDIVYAYNEAGNLFDLHSLNLDYVFYEDPYPEHYPAEYSPKNVAKFVLVCYLPYGFTAGYNFSRLLLDNQKFFKYCNLYFSDNNYNAKITNEKYIKKNSKKLQYFLNIGYPPLEKYIKMNSGNLRYKNVVWTPRWTLNEDIGKSSFLEYRNRFIETCKIHNEFQFSLRPHPMMFVNLRNINVMSDKDIIEYKKLMQINHVVLDDQSSIETVIENNDILICDISSVIIQFFLTGKPVIYCKSAFKLEEEYEEMMKGVYIAENWDDVEHYLLQIENQNDYLYDARQNIIKNYFMPRNSGSTERVIKILADLHDNRKV